MCYGVSDLYIPNPYIITVNMDLVDQFKLESPYQMVYDNTWTLDNFIAQCKTVAIDLDGDGQRDETDRYGFVCTNMAYIDAYWSSCQLPILTKDENNA